MIMMAIPILIAVALYGAVVWLRRGNGGGLGQAIRNSDWHSWKSAVQEKEEELAELRAAEPKR